MTEENRRIFVSYSRNDENFVNKLVDDLVALGADVWLDVRNIQVGSLWDREIQKALEICRYFLVVLSPNSVNSDNVLDEIDLARDEGKEIISILYEQCRIPLRIRRVQYISFENDYAPSLSLLIEDLKRREVIPTSEYSIFPQKNYKNRIISPTELCEVDLSGKVDSLSEPTVVVISNGGTFSVLIPPKAKSDIWADLSLNYPNMSKVRRKVIFVSLLIFILLKDRIDAVDHVVIDDEYAGHGDLLKGHLINLCTKNGVSVDSRKISVREIKCLSPAKQLGHLILSRKHIPDMVINRNEILSLI